VAYRAYLKAQFPIGVRSNLYTTIIVSLISHFVLHPGVQLQYCILYNVLFTALLSFPG